MHSRFADHSIEEKLLGNGHETGVVIVGVRDHCHVGGRAEVGRSLINFKARSAAARQAEVSKWFSCPCFNPREQPGMFGGKRGRRAAIECAPKISPRRKPDSRNFLRRQSVSYPHPPILAISLVVVLTALSFSPPLARPASANLGTIVQGSC